MILCERKSQLIYSLTPENEDIIGVHRARESIYWNGRNLMGRIIIRLLGEKTLWKGTQGLS